MLWHGETRRFYRHVRTTTTTSPLLPPTTTRRFTQVNRGVNLLWNPSCRALRWRGCWLRARQGHVRMAVAMELATALHHSAQPAGPVVAGPREVEEQDKHES